MQIKQYITLDLMIRDNHIVVNAKQGDDKSRYLAVTLACDGAPYAVPEGAAAYFRCLKPDGHSCYNPAAISTEDGSILVELTEQVLAVPGRVSTDVTLVGTGGEVLSSVSFVIYVEPAPVGKNIDSADEAKVLENLIEQAQDKLNGLPWEVTPEGYTDLTGLRQVTAISVVKVDDSTINLTATLEGDEAIEEVITLDGAGYPTMITVDGRECPVSWEGFE